MNTSMKWTRFLFLGVVGAWLCIVAWTFTWKSTPGFMRQESYGIAFPSAVPLPELCSPRILAGLEGPLSNVTDQRPYSLLYTLPTKLFAETNGYTVQRFVHVAHYLVLVLLLVVLVRVLRLGAPAALFFVLYFALSEQTLAHLYEFKLSLTSVTWLTAATLLFAVVFREEPRNGGRVAAAILALPPLIMLSYETYAVARPIAVALVPGFLGWALVLLKRPWRTRVWIASLFLASLFVAASGLLALHPKVRFDMSLFEGRTESVTNFQGELQAGTLDVVRERASELRFLFRFPNHDRFAAETPPESGWLEIILALSIVSALVLLRSGHDEKLRHLLRSRRDVILLALGIMAVGILVPLASTTYVRGHRFLGFYFGSTLVLAILSDVLVRARTPLLSMGTSALLLGAALATFVHRMPVIGAWQPEAEYTPAFQHELVETLAAYARQEKGRRARVVQLCDRHPRPTWQPGWQSALYVSRLACEIGTEEVKTECPCPDLLDEDALCIERSVTATGSQELSYRWYQSALTSR